MTGLYEHPQFTIFFLFCQEIFCLCKSLIKTQFQKVVADKLGNLASFDVKSKLAKSNKINQTL